VACSSADACQAVGSYSSSTGGLQTLGEGLDGSRWRVEPTPSPARDSYLASVSCVRRSWCMAVGQSIRSNAQARALALTWNGVKWTSLRTPLPAGKQGPAGLDAVSCLSRRFCVAVGGFSRAGADTQQQPLAEQWNGSAWTLLSVPNPHAENGSGLQGVSCTTRDACTAGGLYDFADIAQSIFAARYNGSTWTLQKQPNPGDNEFDVESAVSCPGISNCVAVGSLSTLAGEQELAEGWNGSDWVRQATPEPPGAAYAEFRGVSCTTASACMAVGDWSSNQDQFPDLTLAEHWNGTAWTPQMTPNPARATLSSLLGVSCSTARRCTAVGSFYNGTKTKTLVESYGR
jgi:hypothetical protein